jgi:polysaccharide export outer membrane protein
MKKTKTIRIVSVKLLQRLFVVVAAPICILGLCATGCSNKFWEPGDIGRFRQTPAVNLILESLGVAEEAPPVWADAEDPRPIDVMVLETDYAFNPGDTVRISIFELLQDGTPYINDYVVTETGRISIPEVGDIQVEGLTESQLEEEIRQILSPSILKDPYVTVTLLTSQRRTFSILGDGIPAPSRYGIPRYDFRLNDAIATAGGISQFNISNIYVSRRVTGKESVNKPSEQEPADLQMPQVPQQFVPPQQPEQLIEPEQEMLKVITPLTKVHTSGPSWGLVVSSAEMATAQEFADVTTPEEVDSSNFIGQAETYSAKSSSQSPFAPDDNQFEEQLINPAESGRIEWIYQDGEWIPVQVGRPDTIQPPVVQKEPTTPLEEQLPENLQWDQIGAGGVQTRVIKIPADRLSAGDPRYNIVIRPGDCIHVPVDIIGEFCIMGNVNRQGYINITGRPMTLKMAIAAAGGLGPLAWPKRCEVIRRISKRKEEIVMVDLDKIAAGEQPDFFIKPNDLINVGTHITARWRAVLRNAFRATYGFGFIYDRNFADRDFGTRRPIPHWF